MVVRNKYRKVVHHVLKHFCNKSGYGMAAATSKDMSTAAGIQGHSERVKIAVAVEGTKQCQSHMHQGGGE